MRLNISFNPEPVVYRLRRLHRDGPRWYSQELNRQLRASKGGTGRSERLPVVGMTRRIQQATNVTPQKRIARRIRFPRAGFANPRKLIAGGLTLFESLPMRYFKGGLPSGATPVKNEVDNHGRSYVGGAFHAKLKSGAAGKMKRLKPQVWVGGRPQKNPKTNHLPIGWAEHADITPIAYRERLGVLNDLARFWPRQLAARFRREFKRLFRA